MKKLAELSLKNFIYILLFSVLLFSCDFSDKQRRPSASGRAGELIVVMDNSLWKGEAGENFRSIFAASMEMFPQPEPMFNVIQIEHKGFSSLFESHRHIFITEIRPDIPEAKIEGGRDVWSHPQMVVKVIAPDIKTLNETIKSNAEAFIDKFLEAEWERVKNANQRMLNQSIVNRLEEKFGFRMIVPQGYFIAKDKEDFMWIRRTGVKEDLEMSLLVSVFPYKSAEMDFSEKTIWARRDSVTKKHIPGQFPGTYMTTYPDIPPVFREINFNGNYAVEARGLWQVEGDFMGGPFISYTMVDNTGRRLINIDAFVFYPNKNKRDFMRQLQAIIYSLSFVE